MNRFGLAFHHFGLAVSQPETAFAFLAGLGYREGVSVFDPGQGVYAAMRHHPSMPGVEVIWPGSAPSPVDRLVKRRGELVYHLCYQTADTTATLAELDAAGHQVLEVIAPTPAPLFDGLRVSFHIIRGVGLIELIDGQPAQVDFV